MTQLNCVFQTANVRKIAIVALSAPRFLEQVIPAAPDVTVQIAHLAGEGSYSAMVDAALSVFAEASASKDKRMRRAYFDISRIAPRELIATER